MTALLGYGQATPVEVTCRSCNTHPASGKKVERALHEMKHGKLKSGRSGKTLRSRKQAIGIGLSEARKAGKKVPKKSGSS